MPRKAKFGFCLLVALMLATVLPAVAVANHEDYPTEGFGGVQPHVAQAGHEIQDTFGVPYVGGYRAGDPQDHGKGLALDFMVYDDAALGDTVSNHILANWQHYNVKYIIWQQRINFGSGWQPMEDRGSPTQNHFDHVHVSFNAQSSTAVDPPVEDPPAMEDTSRGGPSPVEEEPVTEDDVVRTPESEEPSVGAPAPVEEVPTAEDAVAQPQSASQPAGTSQPGSVTQSSGAGQPGSAGQSGAGQPGSVTQSSNASQPGGAGQVGGILRDVNENIPFPIF